ncbi:glutamate/aspartate transport system substrate-binding protein [Acidovorax soli]|uniref:Glutamate/aspartate transport system substrate-binding protein n=1 Tax=Acidovorax soli TaxID=592050 RepID=A0A7X0PIH3_9BURK|nr:amino acid ABC transporter substrate-binding protein [Acidovorax soli]MBB6562026.1 glutamate/aspartate transport system substrate-binding protein [Acidovorax soli]
MTPWTRTALGAALSLAALSASFAQPQSTLAKMAQTGVIHLSYRDSSVPFSYLNDAKPIGFSIEICDRIVEMLKTKVKRPDLKIERQPVTSQNRIPLVMNGTVDLECGSTTNNVARREQVEFAVNYFYTGTRMMVKKTSGIGSLADLKGKKLATTSGTTNVQVLRKYFKDNSQDTEMLLAKDHADGALLAESGRADAYAMDDILLYGLVANAKNPAEWTIVGEALQVEPYAIMLRKNDPEFKKEVDAALVSLMKSGEFEKLYDKWFLQPIPPRNVPLNVPMSAELKKNLKEFSDRPAAPAPQ